jgi:GT2 family glycosyltransferase
MKPEAVNCPRATIVMTARERHTLAEASIESIVGATRRPYRFMYLDVQSPDWLRSVLARRAGEWGLEVFRFDEPLWPHEARKRVVAGIESDYVVFIDNDVMVEAGWLDALVACADETGAGIVGPLYLWGDGVHPPKIHMAGGKFTEEFTEHGQRHLIDVRLLSEKDPSEVASALYRQPCDFLEYHCTLIRTDLVRDGTLLDGSIRCVHEHVDTALAVRQRGFPIFFEPASRVTYLGLADYALGELDFFRWRWSIEEAERNIEALCSKWNIANEDRSFKGVREFVYEHVSAADPIRFSPQIPADRRTPMRREELKQTRSDLLDLAQERGYRARDLAIIADAYHLAHVLTAGGYRPCGRPFVNHLVGTASVLVRYDFSVEIVAAALMHSAYTHSHPHPDGPEAAVAALALMLGGEGSPIERAVREYTRRESAWTVPPAADTDTDSVSQLPVLEAQILAIAAANEIDMYLSGEIRYSDRTDVLAAGIVRQIARVCEFLGVSGLADTHAQARQNCDAATPELITNSRGSYRIAWAQQSLVPMHRPDHVAALQAGGEASSAERSQLPRSAAAS